MVRTLSLGADNPNAPFTRLVPPAIMSRIASLQDECGRKIARVHCTLSIERVLHPMTAALRRKAPLCFFHLLPQSYLSAILLEHAVPAPVIVSDMNVTSSVSRRNDCAARPAEVHVGNIELGRDGFTSRTLLETPAFATPRGGDGLQCKIGANRRRC
jgi:hypothetical protein